MPIKVNHIATVSPSCAKCVAVYLIFKNSKDIIEADRFLASQKQLDTILYKKYFQSCKKKLKLFVFAYHVVPIAE